MVDSIYAFLDKHGISYTKHEHRPVFTVAEANILYDDISGMHTKNLFLRNHNKSRYFLFVLASEKRADLALLAQELGEKKLHFANPKELYTHLRVTPGSVSILGLIHDSAHRVTLLIDRDVWESEYINAHPNTNTATLTFPRIGIQAFVAHTGHDPRIVSCA